MFFHKQPKTPSTPARAAETEAQKEEGFAAEFFHDAGEFAREGLWESLAEQAVGAIATLGIGAAVEVIHSVHFVLIAFGGFYGFLFVHKVVIKRRKAKTIRKMAEMTKPEPTPTPRHHIHRSTPTRHRE